MGLIGAVSFGADPPVHDASIGLIMRIVSSLNARNIGVRESFIAATRVDYLFDFTVEIIFELVTLTVSRVIFVRTIGLKRGPGYGYPKLQTRKS
jgi:hypothetical protein